MALERGDLLTWRVLHVCLPKLLVGRAPTRPYLPEPPTHGWRPWVGAADEGCRSGLTPLKFAASPSGLTWHATSCTWCERPQDSQGGAGLELAQAHDPLWRTLDALLAADGDDAARRARRPTHKVRGEGNALFAAGLGGARS